MDSIEISEENYERLEIKYLPLLKKTSAQFYKRYTKYGIEYDDLLQQAKLEFLIAIRTFDVTKGVYFGHYARLIINNGLNGMIKASTPNYHKKNKDKSIEQGKDVFDKIFLEPDKELSNEHMCGVYYDNYNENIIEELIAMLPESDRRIAELVLFEEKSIRSIIIETDSKINVQGMGTKVNAIKKQIGVLYDEYHRENME